MKPTAPCAATCLVWRFLTFLGYNLHAKLLLCDNCIAPWNNRPIPIPEETK